MPENDIFFPCEHEILSCAHKLLSRVHKIIILCSQHITHLCTQDDKILSSAHKKKKRYIFRTSGAAQKANAIANIKWHNSCV